MSYQSSEIVEAIAQNLRDIDEMSEDLVLTVIQEQMGGAIDVGISNEQLIDTLLCYRTSECSCFHEMVREIIKVIAAEEEPEDTEKAAFDKMLASVVTNRVQ